MIPVEEKYDFELTAEVRVKIEQAENKHMLIGENELKDLKFIFYPPGGYQAVKRLMDIVSSLGAMLVLFVPMALIALAIFLDDPGDVIFTQYRVGRNGKRFKLYKFRTMKKDTPKYLPTMEMADPDKYITRLGHFLRRSSLDELPQLINVLKGNMSLVGPRPLISDEYEIHQMRMRFGVYSVRPGLTGLAQINGRDTVSPAAQVRWDVKYMERFGFLTDIKILLATIPRIFGGTGIVEGYSINSSDKVDQLSKND